MTFEWEEITDEVLKKVVLVQFIPYSTCSFIDSDGSLTAITEDGQEYFVGFERMPWKMALEILHLFWARLRKKYLMAQSSLTKRKNGVGQIFLGWTYLSEKISLIKFIPNGKNSTMKNGISVQRMPRGNF